MKGHFFPKGTSKFIATIPNPSPRHISSHLLHATAFQRPANNIPFSLSHISHSFICPYCNSPTRTTPTAALVGRILPASQQVHPRALDPRRIALPSRPGFHLLPLLGWNPQLCRKELCHVRFYSYFFIPASSPFRFLSPIHPYCCCTLVSFFFFCYLQFTLTGTLKHPFSLLRPLSFTPFTFST